MKSSSFYHMQEVVNDGDYKTQIDRATLCSQGKHDELFLDEQVGKICISCFAVVEEIRYIFPPFVSLILVLSNYALVYKYIKLISYFTLYNIHLSRLTDFTSHVLHFWPIIISPSFEKFAFDFFIIRDNY